MNGFELFCLTGAVLVSLSIITIIVKLLLFDNTRSLKESAIVSVFSLVLLIIFNGVTFQNIHSKYERNNIAGNVYPNVSCPVKSDGNYSGSCSFAITNKEKVSFLQYLSKYGFRDRGNVKLGEFHPVLSNKETGDLYLKVYTKSSDSPSEKYRGQYVKFTDLPKVVGGVDISKVADKSITDDDKRFNRVSGFDKVSKKPLFE